MAGFLKQYADLPPRSYLHLRKLAFSPKGIKISQGAHTLEAEPLRLFLSPFACRGHRAGALWRFLLGSLPRAARGCPLVLPRRLRLHRLLGHWENPLGRDWPRRIARRHCGQRIFATACGYENCNDLDRTWLWTIFMPKGAASEVI